jgi:hypothetical protein
MGSRRVQQRRDHLLREDCGIVQHIVVIFVTCGIKGLCKSFVARLDVLVIRWWW